MNKFKLVLLFLVLMMVFAACGAAAPSTEAGGSTGSKPTDVPAKAEPTEVAMQEITIDAADYSYTALESLESGWVRVRLTNSGAEPHHVQFLRLNDGVTMEQFQEALKQGEGPALALVSQVGGVGAIAPTGSAQAVLNLPAGQYVILCFIPSPSDQVPHLAKGMIKALMVNAAGGAVAAEPSSDLSIRLQDFSFELPEKIPAGHVTIKVTNDGPEPHEFNILRLADGKTLEDVTQFLNGAGGPPPFTPVGGMNGLDKGLSGYIEFDFQPGSYIAICNIPSPNAQGKPHSALGMIKEFTVVASESSSFPAGKFVLSTDRFRGFNFNADGTWVAVDAGEFVGEGTYSAKDGVYIEETNNQDCPAPMSYEYIFDGTNLTFQLTDQSKTDPCQPRKDAFNGVSYVIKK